MIKNKIISSTLMFGVLAAILLTSSTAIFYTPNSAWAVNDPNGIELLQPYGSYTLTYGTAWYSTSGAFGENFRTDGSMRMEWHNTGTASLMMAGYFHLSNGSCDNFPKEEISAKVNGGPHTTSSPPPATDTSTTPWPNENAADTMDLGGIAFDGSGAGSGDQTRVRFEKTHPNYGPATLTDSGTSIPLATNLCDTPDGWVGVMAFKTNIDTNCDGVKDRFIIRNYVDISGLSAGGAPQNNWQLTYKHTFYPPTFVPSQIKAWDEPWVKKVGHSADREQTWRIDNQDYNDWTDATPNYKFLTLKVATATTNSCGSGLTSQAVASDAGIAIPKGEELSTQDPEAQQLLSDDEQQKVDETVVNDDGTQGAAAVVVEPTQSPIEESTNNNDNNNTADEEDSSNNNDDEEEEK